MSIGIVATDGVVGCGVTVVFEVSLLLMTLLVSVLNLGQTLQLDLGGVLFRWQFFRLLPLSQLYVLSSRELLLCVVLLHWFRGLERIYGSARFLALLLFSLAVFPLVVASFAVVLGGVPLVARPGPFALIFASLVIFWCDVPPTLRIGGKRWAALGLSDKWFVYALALQLAVTVPSLDSVVSALAGICCGLLHRSPHLRMSRAVVRLPLALLQRAEFTRRTYEPPIFRNVSWHRYWASGASFEELWTNAHRRTTPEQQARIDSMLQPFRPRTRRRAPVSVLPFARSLAPPLQQHQQHLQQPQDMPSAAPAHHQPPPLASSGLPSAVQQLVDMGFDEAAVMSALHATGSDAQAAAELLLRGVS
jgi:hypothetical protein